MDTDILGGIQLGYRTVLTLSGVSKMSNLKKYAYNPDLVIDSLAKFDIDQWFDATLPVKTKSTTKNGVLLDQEVA